MAKDHPTPTGPIAPVLRILETRVYRGPNVWSYAPAIHLVVDLGALGGDEDAGPRGVVPLDGAAGHVDALGGGGHGWVPLGVSRAGGSSACRG